MILMRVQRVMTLKSVDPKLARHICIYTYNVHVAVHFPDDVIHFVSVDRRTAMRTISFCECAKKREEMCEWIR